MKNMPPIPQTIFDQLKAIKVGEGKAFMENPAHSVRAIISRMREDENPKVRAMQFVTKKADDGVHAQVWRLK